MGTAVGATCYRDDAEAAAYYCASLSGFTAEGYVHCTSAELVDGAMRLSLSVETPTGTIARTIDTTPAQCAPQDLETYAPHLAAWVGGVVVIVSLRMLYRHFFSDSATA